MRKYIKKGYLFFIRVFSYCLVLAFVDFLFKNTIYIDKKNYVFWLFLVSFIVSVLNVTVKPVLFKITIPITGLTLGLFYPFINLFILKITSWILNGHFEIYGIWYAVFASIFISVLNVILDESFVKKIDRWSKNESNN